jgi:hypothetical protein
MQIKNLTHSTIVQIRMSQIDGRSIAWFLEKAELSEFADGLKKQGFHSVQDLLDLHANDVAGCAAEAGMQRGHLVRLNRWLSEYRHKNPPVSPSRFHAAAAADEEVPQPQTPANASLRELRKLDAIPRALCPSFYWDLDSHPFSHASLVTEAGDVISILEGLHPYIEWWLTDEALKKHDWFADSEDGAGVLGVRLGAGSGVPGRPLGDLDNGRVVFSVENPAVFHPECVFGERFEKEEDEINSVPHLFLGPGARILGGTFDLSKGSIFLGGGVTVEPGAYVKGPCIIGEGCELRTGAYLRGDVLLGGGVCVRCELKHSLVMDNSELCHPGYVGDSLLGFGCHFGCQALTANLPLMGTTIVLTCTSDDGSSVVVDLERRKLGSVMGDGCQLGCNSVAEPGAMFGPRTFVYPLTRLPKGFYGPNELIKNKPLEHGVIERSVLR